MTLTVLFKVFQVNTWHFLVILVLTIGLFNVWMHVCMKSIRKFCSGVNLFLVNKSRPYSNRNHITYQTSTHNLSKIFVVKWNISTMKYIKGLVILLWMNLNISLRIVYFIGKIEEVYTSHNFNKMKYRRVFYSL